MLVVGEPPENARQDVRFGVKGFLRSFQTLGVVYAEIGITPLYVLNSLWGADGDTPSSEDVLGGVSAIIWTLTIIFMVKYILIGSYFASQQQDGGTFSLYLGLYPHQHSQASTLANSPTQSSLSAPNQQDTINSKARHRTHVFHYSQWLILSLTLLGTGMTLSDGILSPAVMITSTVAGIEFTTPGITRAIMPVSISALAVMFAVQRFGTHRLAFGFAPIVTTWYILLFVTGVINIASYPGILRAFDPSQAVLLLIRNKNLSYLSGVVLVIGGCESLFAFLGRFDVLSIQIAFGSVVYPSLVVTFLGQGARLITGGYDVLPNIFWCTIPGKAGQPLYWVVYVLAMLTTLVALQATINWSFSVVQQLVNMKVLPCMEIKHTSRNPQDTVYISLANYLLAIGNITMVAVFIKVQSLTDIFGFAISVVMVITTILVTLQMHYVARQPLVVSGVFLIVFGFIECLFLGATLPKVPEGAWIPLVIAGILCLIMLFHTWAKDLEYNFDNDEMDGIPYGMLESVVQGRDEICLGPPESASGAVDRLSFLGNLTDDERLHMLSLSREAGCGVFYRLTCGQSIPHSFKAYLRHWSVLPEIVVFLTICVISSPEVDTDYRYQVTRIEGMKGLFSVTYLLGYREDMSVDMGEVFRQIAALKSRVGSMSDDNNQASFCPGAEETCNSAKHTVHFVPKCYITSKSRNVVRPHWAEAISVALRRYMLEDLYRPIARMFPETTNWQSPIPESMVLLGVNSQI